MENEKFASWEFKIPLKYTTYLKISLTLFGLGGGQNWPPPYVFLRYIFLRLRYIVATFCKLFFQLLTTFTKIIKFAHIFFPTYADAVKKAHGGNFAPTNSKFNKNEITHDCLCWYNLKTICRKVFAGPFL